MKKIGLALSGGGVRAAAFHTGVLRFLADQSALGKVVQISTVSGGSLLVGLIYKLSGYRWPSDQEFKDVVETGIRNQLTGSSLQRTSLKMLLKPGNWRFVSCRSEIISLALRQVWGIDVNLDAVEVPPHWSINGTTAETGRRFRFKGTSAGDYDIGYANVADFPLARALAMSAAFPGGIGPLNFEPNLFCWYKRKSWEADPSTAELIDPPTKLHLYDGGIYDNLGLEPIFDVGTRKIKEQSAGETPEFLIVSDAGAPLERYEIPGSLNPLRFKRLADILMSQARALRVRSLIGFLQSHSDSGMYLQIGRKPLEAIETFGPDRLSGSDLDRFKQQRWLAREEVDLAASESTHFDQLSKPSFDRLKRHGYETASWNLQLFS